MPKKWTVMIYMAAGDDQKLDGHAVRDLREMERADIGQDVNVVVHIKRAWPATPQQYRISKGCSEFVPTKLTETNMGRRENLSAFLTWARQQFPAEKYALILWGHAYGLGFGRDHGNALKLAELAQVLDKFKGDGNRLELLGCNACAMSYAEAAFQLSGSVKYLVASQVSVPFAGWPYDSILTRVDKVADGRALGERIVERYVNDVSPVSGDRVALTLLDLGKASTLEPLLKALTDRLKDALSEPHAPARDRISQIRAAFQATAVGDVRPLVDVMDLCTELEALSRDLAILEGVNSVRRNGAQSLQALKDAAEALRLALEAKDGIIAAHRGHPDLDDLHGLGIYAPFVSQPHELDRLGLSDDVPDMGRSDYKALGLPLKTGWGELVFETLRLGLPIEVATCIECTGTADRADRDAVSQLVVSLDSIFETFDRTTAALQVDAKRLLNEPANGAMLAEAASPVAAAAAFGVLQLVDRKQLTELAKNGKNGSSGVGPPADDAAKAAKAEEAAAREKVARSKVALNEMAKRLTAFEDALRDVERAVEQTLTNGTFGLGPSLSPTAGGLFASGLSKFGFGLGSGPLKTGSGLPPEGPLGSGPLKTGSGLLPEGGSGPALLVVGDKAAGIVAVLFTQAGEVLHQLEAAAAEVETSIAMTLGGATGALGFDADQARTFAKAEFARAFNGLFNASRDARRVLRRVVSDPGYGIGRGADETSQDVRAELARAAGLSGRVLKLL